MSRTIHEIKLSQQAEIVFILWIVNNLKRLFLYETKNRECFSFHFNSKHLTGGPFSNEMEEHKEVDDKE